MAMWPDDEQHGGRIDAAIDEVARRMTEGAPDSAFKSRVLARVGAGRADVLPHTWWNHGRRLAWMLSPVAVAALVIIAIVVFRASNHERRSVPDFTQSRTDVAQRSNSAGAVKPSDAIRDRGPANDVASAPRTAERVVRPTHGPVRAAASDAPTRGALRPTSIDELDALAPAPLEVESIRLAALPASSIRVAPLETITPIDVEPLVEPDEGRDGESPRRPL